MHDTRTGERAARIVRLAAALLVLLGLLPPAAAAHQQLRRAEPARDAVVRTVPAELRLHFNEPVQLAFTRIELIGPDGVAVPLGEAGLVPDSARVLVVPLPAGLRAGRHVVRWSTASRDGHPVRDEYAFTIASDAAGLAPEPPPAPPLRDGAAPPASTTETPAAAPRGEPAVFGSGSPGYVLLRWVAYLALMGVLGTVAFVLLVLGRLGRHGPPDERALVEPAARRAAAVGLVCAVAVGLAAVARLYAQSLAIFGPGPALDGARLQALLGGTMWGWGWAMQAAGALLAAVGFAAARRGVRAGWPLAAVAALLLATAPALSGHAAAATGGLGLLAMLLQVLHVLAAGGWLGGLLLLIVAGVPVALRAGTARRGAAVAALVRIFSPLALAFAALLVLTGVAAAAIHGGSVPALIGSRYGTVLLVKLALVSLVFAAGAYNYLRVRPALGDDSGAGRLRRSAVAELGMGAAVLLATAVLVATAPPRDAGGVSDAPSSPTAPAVARG